MANVKEEQNVQRKIDALTIIYSGQGSRTRKPKHSDTYYIVRDYWLSVKRIIRKLI